MKTILPLISLALFLILSGTVADARQLLPRARGNQHKAGTLIVGGRPAKQGEAPYQLSLKVGGEHYCGGSLVQVDGLQVAVTAAHCIPNPVANYYDIVAGDINFADNTGIEQIKHVDRIVMHPNYTMGIDAQEYDIALLFLNGSYILNENISTVPLPTQGQVTLQGNLTVSGWGDLYYLGTSPDELQIVSIPVVNDTACQKAYEDWWYQVHDSQICTVAPNGDLNPCHGDSGGPAVSDAGYLAGVVSWGYDCGHPDYPAVYTKVSHYVDWIHSTVASHKKSG